MTRYYYYYDVVLMFLPMKQWASMILKNKKQNNCQEPNVDCQSYENAIFSDRHIKIQIEYYQLI